MNYQYTVRDPLGKTHNGVLEAATQEEAAQMLRGDGFQVMQVESEDDDGRLFPRRIKKSEVVYVTDQLAIMVDTGITLSVALEGIAEQADNPSLQKLLMELKSNVEGGEDFSAALARHPKYFDHTYVSLIKASEQTGLLAEMLDRISAYMQKEIETRSKVRGAMAYPTVMLVVAVAVTIFLLTFVLPKFQPLFNAKAATLPKMTIVMLCISNALLGYWYWWLAGAAALVVGFLVGKRTEPGKNALDWIRINMPVLGPMYRKVIISRSIRTLGTLLESGVSVLDALELSASVAGNLFYKQMWLRVVREVTNGSQICEALRDEPLMPPTLVQMIGSGEQTAKLELVLKRLSRHYDREVATALKAATSLIEPVMIVVMGVVVGSIAMGLLLPIFSLSRGG